MKVLVERHAENDKIEAEKRAKLSRDLHTIKCDHCKAILCFPNEAVDHYTNGYAIKCPCCEEKIFIEKETIENINKMEGDADFVGSARRSYLGSRHGNTNVEPSIEVIEEGNFHMHLMCSNCESELQFDYRDCTYEPINDITRVKIRDYPDLGYTITCPVCGKKLLAKR